MFFSLYEADCAFRRCERGGEREGEGGRKEVGVNKDYEAVGGSVEWN